MAKHEGDAPVEHWDSIIAHQESVIKSYEKDYKDYLNAVWAKKRKGNLRVERRILKNIADNKVTLKILKANRKRLYAV